MVGSGGIDWYMHVLTVGSILLDHSSGCKVLKRPRLPLPISSKSADVVTISSLDGMPQHRL